MRDLILDQIKKLSRADKEIIHDNFNKVCKIIGIKKESSIYVPEQELQRVLQNVDLQELAQRIKGILAYYNEENPDYKVFEDMNGDPIDDIGEQVASLLPGLSKPVQNSILNFEDESELGDYLQNLLKYIPDAIELPGQNVENPTPNVQQKTFDEMLVEIASSNAIPPNMIQGYFNLERESATNNTLINSLNEKLEQITSLLSNVFNGYQNNPEYENAYQESMQVMGDRKRIREVIKKIANIQSPKDTKAVNPSNIQTKENEYSFESTSFKKNANGNGILVYENVWEVPAIGENEEDAIAAINIEPLKKIHSLMRENANYLSENEEFDPSLSENIFSVFRSNFDSKSVRNKRDKLRREIYQGVSQTEFANDPKGAIPWEKARVEDRISVLKHPSITSEKVEEIISNNSEIRRDLQEISFYKEILKDLDGYSLRVAINDENILPKKYQEIFKRLYYTAFGQNLERMDGSLSLSDVYLGYQSGQPLFEEEEVNRKGSTIVWEIQQEAFQDGIDEEDIIARLDTFYSDTNIRYFHDVDQKSTSRAYQIDMAQLYQENSFNRSLFCNYCGRFRTECGPSGADSVYDTQRVINGKKSTCVNVKEIDQEVILTQEEISSLSKDTLEKFFEDSGGGFKQKECNRNPEQPNCELGDSLIFPERKSNTLNSSFLGRDLNLKVAGLEMTTEKTDKEGNTQIVPMMVDEDTQNLISKIEGRILDRLDEINQTMPQRRDEVSSLLDGENQKRSELLNARKDILDAMNSIDTESEDKMENFKNKKRKKDLQLQLNEINLESKQREKNINTLSKSYDLMSSPLEFDDLKSSIRSYIESTVKLHPSGMFPNDSDEIRAKGSLSEEHEEIAGQAAIKLFSALMSQYHMETGDLNKARRLAGEDIYLLFAGGTHQGSKKNFYPPKFIMPEVPEGWTPEKNLPNKNFFTPPGQEGKTRDQRIKDLHENIRVRLDDGVVSTGLEFLGGMSSLPFLNAELEGEDVAGFPFLFATDHYIQETEPAQKLITELFKKSNAAKAWSIVNQTDDEENPISYEEAFQRLMTEAGFKEVLVPSNKPIPVDQYLEDIPELPLESLDEDLQNSVSSNSMTIEEARFEMRKRELGDILKSRYQEGNTPIDKKNIPFFSADDESARASIVDIIKEYFYSFDIDSSLQSGSLSSTISDNFSAFMRDPKKDIPDVQKADFAVSFVANILRKEMIYAGNLEDSKKIAKYNLALSFVDSRTGNLMGNKRIKDALGHDLPDDFIDGLRKDFNDLKFFNDHYTLYSFREALNSSGGNEEQSLESLFNSLKSKYHSEYRESPSGSNYEDVGLERMKKTRTKQKDFYGRSDEDNRELIVHKLYNDIIWFTMKSGTSTKEALSNIGISVSDSFLDEIKNYKPNSNVYGSLPCAYLPNFMPRQHPENVGHVFDGMIKASYGQRDYNDIVQNVGYGQYDPKAGSNAERELSRYRAYRTSSEKMIKNSMYERPVADSLYDYYEEYYNNGYYIPGPTNRMNQLMSTLSMNMSQNKKRVEDNPRPATMSSMNILNANARTGTLPSSDYYLLPTGKYVNKSDLPAAGTTDEEYAAIKNKAKSPFERVSKYIDPLWSMQGISFTDSMSFLQDVAWRGGQQRKKKDTRRKKASYDSWYKFSQKVNEGNSGSSDYVLVLPFMGIQNMYSNSFHKTGSRNKYILSKPKIVPLSKFGSLKKVSDFSKKTGRKVMVLTNGEFSLLNNLGLISEEMFKNG